MVDEFDCAFFNILKLFNTGASGGLFGSKPAVTTATSTAVTVTTATTQATTTVATGFSTPSGKSKNRRLYVGFLAHLV